MLNPRRLVRDQANKTFDLYLQRTRKYGNSLPDSALPPPSTIASNGAGPRMGTLQNDSSWAGWAISSFTNKIATASGEMQSKSTIPQPQARSNSDRTSSLPPTANASHSTHVSSSASTLHRKALIGNTSAPVLTRTSSDEFFGVAQDEDDEFDQAWGEIDDEPFFDASSEPGPKIATSSVAAYDDGGEPDFEGWLTAQAQVKTKAPLPKGLAKSSAASNGRPATAARKKTTSGSLGSSQGALKAGNSGVKSKATATTVIDTKPKEFSVEDDWGDAWD